MHAEVSLASSRDGLTRSEGVGLPTGDPGKWNMQINKTATTTTARGGGVAALC